MSKMRTTLTLDPDVAARLRTETASGKVSLKEAVNRRLREGYGLEPRQRRRAFRVEPHHSGGYCGGVDALKLNQLVDELEAEAFVAEAKGAQP